MSKFYYYLFHNYFYRLNEIFKIVQGKFTKSLLGMMSHPAVQRLMQKPENIMDLTNPTADKIFEKSRDNQDFVEVLSTVLGIDKETINNDVAEHFRVKISLEANNQSGSSNTNTNTKSNSNDKFKKHVEAEAAFNKANDLFVNEEYDKALEHYDDAIHHDNKEIKYYINRAACYLKMGDDALVIDDCDNCFKSGHQCARLYYLKVEGYKLMKHFDQAKECNAKALEIYPTNEKLLEQQKTLA